MIAEKRIHIFLQARLRSKRLPEKALLKIEGKTVFELIVERLSRVTNAQKVVLVTGPKENNLALIQEAERLGVEYFCGSEENLLDRFYQAAKAFESDVIVRATGDNIFVDPSHVKKAIEYFLQNTFDIVFMKKGYALGPGIDIFTKSMLEKTWEHQKDTAQLMEAITTEPGVRIGDMPYAPDISKYHLTLDYPEQYELAKRVYGALYPQNPNFSLEDVVRFLEKDMV